MDTRHSLSLNHPGETLALVSRTFGFLPEDSLVVIGLDDGVTGGHLRIDLPAGGESAGAESLRPFTESIAACLVGEDADPVPQAVLVLLFAPEPARPGEHPYQGLLSALRSSLRHEGGVSIVQTWYAGGGYIRDYDCREEVCCGYPGLDMQEELQQVLASHPLFSESTGEDDPGVIGPERVVAWFETPPFGTSSVASDAPRTSIYSADEVEQVRSAVRTHTLRFMQRTEDSGRPPYLCVAAWDAAISRAESCGAAEWLMESPEQIAAMLTAVRDSGLRDTIVPMSALDFETAIYGYLAFCAGRRTGLEPEKAAELLGQEGRPVPERMEAYIENYQRSFLGQTGRRPAWERIDALETVLRLLHAFAEDETRSHILSLMGWVEWARGRGSVSGAYIDRCLEEFPENQLAQLIGRYMDAGGICPWAKVKRHSWSWNNRGWTNTAQKFLPPRGNEQRGAPVMPC